MLSLLSPTSIMAGIIVALSLSNVLLFKLYTGAKDDLVTYQAEVSLAQAQIEADIQRKLRLSEQVTAEVKSDLADALAKLRKRPAVRVLQSNCNSGTSQAVPAPSGLSLDTPLADSVDTGITLTPEQCAERLGDGIEDAVRLAWLQEWVREQHEVSK